MIKGETHNISIDAPIPIPLFQQQQQKIVIRRGLSEYININ